MLDDQQNDAHRSLRPQLQVRVSEETEPIAIPSAISDSLNDTLAEASHKEKTGHPNPSNSGNNTPETPAAKSIPFWRPENLPRTLQWIPANWSWSKWKPVIRSALAAWISLLLFLIPTTLNVMGQVSLVRSTSHCFASSEKLPGSFPDHHR